MESAGADRTVSHIAVRRAPNISLSGTDPTGYIPRMRSVFQPELQGFDQKASQYDQKVTPPPQYPSNSGALGQTREVAQVSNPSNAGSASEIGQQAVGGIGGPGEPVGAVYAGMVPSVRASVDVPFQDPLGESETKSGFQTIERKSHNGIDQVRKGAAETELSAVVSPVSGTVTHVRQSSKQDGYAGIGFVQIVVGVSGDGRNVVVELHHLIVPAGLANGSISRGASLGREASLDEQWSGSGDPPMRGSKNPQHVHIQIYLQKDLNDGFKNREYLNPSIVLKAGRLVVP